MARPWRGGDTLVVVWANGEGAERTEELEHLATDLEGKWHEVQLKRKAAASREVKRWAAAATLSVAPAATKPREGILPLTASAAKIHLGETDAQVAADKGVNEWAKAWKAGTCDGADEILRAVEAMECIQQHEEIILQPVGEDKVRMAALKFRGRTGVGKDWLRPRHVATMSKGAREALAWMLNRFEAKKRWPLEVREVLAVAVAKKGEGCR